MHGRDALVELLSSTPESIAAMLDIEAAAPEVRRQLQMKFWRAAKQRLADDIAEDGDLRDWVVRSVGHISRPAHKETGLLLMPDCAVEDAHHLTVGLFQDSLGFFFGAYFPKKRPRQSFSPLDKLTKKLVDRDFDSEASGEGYQYWVAWKYLEIGIVDHGFLSLIASNIELLLDRLTDPLLEFAREYRDEICGINRLGAGPDSR